MPCLRAPGFLPIRAVSSRLPAGDRPGVNRHLDPGDERGVVGAQPDDRGGHLARVAEAGHRLRAQDLLLALGDSLDISGVLIAPGQTQFTRMPWSAYSTAAFL